MRSATRDEKAAGARSASLGLLADAAKNSCSMSLQGVPQGIQLRQISHFAKADPAYGKGGAERLGLASSGLA